VIPTLRALRRERGSILIEALVSSALLGVALVALIGTVSSLSVAGRIAEEQASAQAALRGQVARLKAVPYQINGDYSAWLDPVPAGLTRARPIVEWWNSNNTLPCEKDSDPCWQLTPDALVGLQRITVTYSSGSALSLASVQFLKRDK
jgi:hypothetical protein